MSPTLGGEEPVPIETLEAVGEALTALWCPYYRQEGDKTCGSECWDEPSCVTNQPQEGWVAYARGALKEDTRTG